MPTHHEHGPVIEIGPLLAETIRYVVDRFESLSDRVRTLEDEVSQLSDMLDATEKSLDDAIARVQSDVAGLQTKIAELQAKVDAGSATEEEKAQLLRMQAKADALDPVKDDTLDDVPNP